MGESDLRVRSRGLHVCLSKTIVANSSSELNGVIQHEHHLVLFGSQNHSFLFDEVVDGNQMRIEWWDVQYIGQGNWFFLDTIYNWREYDRAYSFRQHDVSIGDADFGI